MKEHFSSRVTKLLVILALAIVASVMFVFVGCGEQHVHTWTQTNEQAATCTADGFIEYTCEGCGDVRQETVQATGHQWKDDGALQTHPATCTQDGYYYKLCTVCNYEETSSRIPATGHTMAFADVTVTLPTCTTDGSVTGKCADCGADVTWTADEIAAGARLTDIPEENVTVDNKTTEYYDPAHNGQRAYFLQALTHDYTAAENAPHCVAAYTNRTLPYDAAFGTQDTNYYWNYCKRCDTAFEVEKHGIPAGYTPCKVAVNPNNPGEDLKADKDAPQIGTGYAQRDESYAYQCTVCENYIAVSDHSYKLMSLVNDDLSKPEWEAAPADAAFTCEYYEVCEYCGAYRISAPHKPNMDAPTCTDAVVCTVCQKVMENATGHETFVQGPFGDFKLNDLEVKATCVADGYRYVHCEACAKREAAGEDIEWKLGENYKTQATGEKKTGHTYNATAIVFNAEKGEAELAETIDKNIKYVYDTSVDAIGCARPYWFQDVCQTKGCTEATEQHIRIKVKPAVYTMNDKNELVAYTVPATGLSANGDYYFDKDTKLTANDIAAYNADMYIDAEGNYWAYTDDQGRYGYQKAGTHTWELQLLNYDTDTTLKGDYVQAKCDTLGRYMYYCEKCGSYSWLEVSLDRYVEDFLAANGGSVTVEVNKEDKTFSTAADYKAYLLTNKAYHTDGENMFECGHPECPSCTTKEHKVQYTIMFSTSLDGDYEGVTAPTIDTFYGWTCLDDTHEKTNLDAYIEKYLSGDDKFSYEITMNADGTGAVTKDNYQTVGSDWYQVGRVNGNDAYSQTITVYVTATPKVAYTIIFNTDALSDTLKSNEAFEMRTVYVAQTDKSQLAPVVTGFRFNYTLADGSAFTFSQYAWNNMDVVKEDLTSVTVDEVVIENALVIYVK